MRQLEFIEKGKLEWREAADPKLEGDREALVRPVALATCDIDVAFVQGRFPANSFAFGHECVAEVTEDRRFGRSGEAGRPGECPVPDLLRRMRQLPRRQDRQLRVGAAALDLRPADRR